MVGAGEGGKASSTGAFVGAGVTGTGVGSTGMFGAGEAGNASSTGEFVGTGVGRTGMSGGGRGENGSGTPCAVSNETYTHDIQIIEQKRERRNQNGQVEVGYIIFESDTFDGKSKIYVPQRCSMGPKVTVHNR